MCPACLATVGLYVLGVLSAGAGTTLLATTMLRKSEPTTNEGDHHAGEDRIEK